jgi:hypothetical protein
MDKDETVTTGEVHLFLQALLERYGDSNHSDCDDTDSLTDDDTTLTELREETFYADAAPADPSVLNEGADGDRTLDELF